MAQDWELTPAQLDRWTARMTLLFAGKGPLLALAGGDKTLSGYMGEFKLGRPRALRYFLAEPRRLGKLGRLLGVEPSALRSAFEEARASVRPSAGHMLVPGFEDWGWLPTQEVFHESGSGETPRKRRRLRLAGAGRTASSQGIADALPDGGVISIVASPGMGAAALIDAVVERASERHWSVQTGPMLDGDRVIRRLARGEALTPELREWASKDGHAVLRLVDGRWTEGLRGHKARFDMREVDADWCRGFYERVSRLAPRRWRAKLASVEPAEFADEVARWTSPGPVVAGCVLRALAAGTARDGASMCEAMLVRRAEAQGRADLAQLLIGVSGSLPALRCALMSPEGPDVLSETLETEAVREARSVIDGLRLNRREREALDRVLPQISGERVLHALETLGALELSRVPQLLGAGLLDDAAARRALADPGLLPVALRCRDRGLLAAAARTAAGPAMINRALSELDDPGFAVAVGTGSAPESWLDVSAADANLVARLLACGVSFGTFLPLGGKDPRRTVLRALRHVALDTGPRPSVAAVATAATAFLDLRSLQLPDVELRCRLVRALALGAPEELDDDGIWCSALELGWAIPDAWVQHRLETVDGALGLASVSEGSLGERLAGLAFAHGRGSVDVNGGIWGRALDAVARHDSRSAIELLGAMLERFVAEAAELEPLARFAAQLRDDSHLRVHQLLRLVVLGTAAPALNRHRRALRARLRQPLDGLSALLDRDDFALEPWTGPGWKSDYTALPRLLEFAYSPDELVRLLRTPDGRLGPFWHQAANAGVPTEALVALYHDVRKGRVAVVPGRGAPSEQEAAAHVETHGRARPPQLDLYGVLCERLDADDIAALPDSPDPDAEAPPSAGKHWIGSPGFRTYYWRFHRTLDDDDVLWGMLRSDSYPNGLDKRMAEFEGQQIPEINAATRTIDAPVLERVIAGSPGAPQTESRWHLLVGATLALDLSTEALFTLIDRYAHWELDAHFPEGGSGLHMPVHLFTRVIERDPGRAREWLVDRLRSDPGWFDSRPVAGWFEQVGCPPAEIETALERLCADGTCGATLLPALVRVGGDVGPWLARTETEAAALNVLTGDALGEEELVATLGALRRTPPVEALRRILRVKKDRAFSVLERGCQSWDPDARRGLWLAVGRAAGSHWQREAAWRRASGA